MYPDLEKVKESVINIGKLIKVKGLPKSLTPMIFAFTSNGSYLYSFLLNSDCLGRVSKGAQEIFNLLPH